MTPGYFEAMGAKLVKGRFFDDRDGGKALPAIMVDKKLAQRFWPDQDPIGRRLYRPIDINNLTAITDKTVFLTVVGVVEDLKLHDLTEGEKTVGAYFYPMAQDTSRFITFAVKTAGEPESFGSALRSRPGRPRSRAAGLRRRRPWSREPKAALVNRRSSMVLSATFGLVALFLSAIGIYGVLGYLVVQRRKEIGIRMALGSSGGAIFELIIREGLLAGRRRLPARCGGRVRAAAEPGEPALRIEASDPLVLGAVTAALALVALLACALPARRATRIDPLIALTE